MRFAYSWLLDCIDVHCSPEFLVDKLSSIGVEAQLLPSLREEYGDSFVVVKVEGVRPHPRADKLVLCDVFDGCTISNVVCGASNVREGMLTVLAREGSVVPKSGAVISRTSIRGEESCGMLCSLSELGVAAADSAGIADLSDFTIGESFFPGDEVIEITVTPNRGDCLGVYGVARELAAAGIGVLKEFPAIDVGNIPKNTSPTINVKMRCDGVFSGRAIRSIKNSEYSPKWLMDRLMSSGIKLVSCVVDILNYVMLLLNRPMHVYDMGALNGDLLIGKSDAKGSMKALNGKIYELTTEDIVVKDSNGTTHCLAGIIGAEASACKCSTEDIFLESAWYDPVSIAMSSRVHNISTEAAHRFSRHVDLCTIELGLDFATSLVLQYCGGEPCKSVKSARGAVLPDVTIDFRVDSISRVCNVCISQERIAAILESLGFSICRSDERLWKVKVPTWRVFDVKSEIDLVEEVIRIHGCDDIEMEEVGSLGGRSLCDNAAFIENKMRVAMLSAGLTEVVTWSFLASGVIEKFGFSVDDMRIENPISNQFDVMRPTVLPNLLQIASENQACGSESVGIFEIGDVYLSIDKSEQVICGLRSGNFLPKNLHSEVRGFDFFDVKSDVEQLLAQFYVNEGDLRYVPLAPSRSYMHPGRSAAIYLCDVLCGYVGEVHPEIIESLRLKHSAVCFEMFTGNIAKYSSLEKNKSGFCVNKYQAVKRDFAFVLDRTVSAATLVDSVKSIRNVEEVRIFDVYNGSGIPSDKTSIAVSVIISSKEGTMTEEDIKDVSDNIILSVERKTFGKLRLDYES